MYQSRCMAKNSWWWAERLPETCRVVTPIKLEFSASVGFIHKGEALISYFAVIGLEKLKETTKILSEESQQLDWCSNWVSPDYKVTVEGEPMCLETLKHYSVLQRLEYFIQPLNILTSEAPCSASRLVTCSMKGGGVLNWSRACSCYRGCHWRWGKRGQGNIDGSLGGCCCQMRMIIFQNTAHNMQPHDRSLRMNCRTVSRFCLRINGLQVAGSPI